MKKITVLVICLAIVNLIMAQAATLPISKLASTDSTKPLIFYISGDGGFNKFSNSFMQSLNQQGYAVIGLNAKDYFWTKKKPQEAAQAIESTIAESNKEWKRKNIVLVGYSFGADVAPFMITHFSASTASKTTHLILLSPSAKTDFEIHVMQMLGLGKDDGESVPDEINKIRGSITIITGDDEKTFPFEKLTIKPSQIIKMPGGHHYDGDISALTKQVVQQIK